MVLFCIQYYHRFWGYCGGYLIWKDIVALIPGILVSYFIEFNKIKSNESVVAFLDQLEHLDTLSKEKLRELSKKVKNRRYRL